MFTDMVGSTAAAQKDEASALKLLETQDALLRPIFSTHRGRVVKSTGDGFLVVFDSALRAVQCAIDIQRMVRERNTAITFGPLLLRIGIHLGDVEERDNDVFGDSVNIASRIEPLAEPGGICVTEPVFGQVRNKITNRLEKLEPQNLKNVQFPIDVYKVNMPSEHGVGDSEPPDKRRVAVMPLVNMISDPAEAYFADGMTEEIISAISKVRELDVISRTSVNQYKNTTKKAAEIGRDLRVGSLLEGSVRKAGNRVRIAVQLIDASSDRHLWAENYDRTLEDVFSIQSEIAQSVAAMLKVALLENDRRRLEKAPTKDPEAHSLYLKGKAARTHRIASEFFQKAIDKDPEYALAYVALANAILQMGFAEESSPKESSERGEALVRRALELDPSLAEAHAVMAVALFSRGEYSGIEKELNLALELDPNHIITLHHKSNWERFKRHFEESERLARRELELDPLSLDTIQNIAGQLLLLRHPEEAIELFSKVRQIDPEAFWAKDYLGLAFVQKGRFDEGIALIQEAIRGEKTFSLEGSTNLLGYALGKAGRFAELKELLVEALDWHERNQRGALPIASIYASLGESDKALEWLEKSFAERPYMLPAAFSDFYFEELWADPRFGALRSRLGVT
jgi:adenylate cyclase